MSEFQVLPSAEVYDEVIGKLPEDAYYTYKETHKRLPSFFRLATNASRTALYLEDYSFERRLIDPSMNRAKAFMRGVVFAEMVNENIFQEEFHDTAFKWLINSYKTLAIRSGGNDMLTPQERIREQLSGTHAIFKEGLLPSTIETIHRLAQSNVLPDAQSHFSLGMGVQLAAGYGYQSHINSTASPEEVESRGL